MSLKREAGLNFGRLGRKLSRKLSQKYNFQQQELPKTTSIRWNSYTSLAPLEGNSQEKESGQEGYR
jgi:hypothetical protein